MTTAQVVSPPAQPPTPVNPSASNGNAGPSRGFVFINDTNPERDSKSEQKRRLVRAQAARGPHANTLINAKGSTSTRPAGHNKRQQLKRNKRPQEDRVQLDLLGIGAPASSSDSTSQELSSQQRGSSSATSNFEDKGSSSDATQSRTSISPPSNNHPTPRSTSGVPANTSRRRAPPPTAAPTPTSPLIHPAVAPTGWVAPFMPTPTPTSLTASSSVSRPYIPLLLHHYINNMAQAIPELDAGHPFILRTQWFPMVITSPATLGVVLLTAASHYAACHHTLSRPEIQTVLLDLKHWTLCSINAAISTQRASGAKVMDDVVLGSVAKMASYEAMFGSPSLFHTHMMGLKRMVDERGGLESLTGLKGLIRRMMLWIDVNSAFLLGNKNQRGMYFATKKPLAGGIQTVLPGVVSKGGWVESEEVSSSTGAHTAATSGPDAAAAFTAAGPSAATMTAGPSLVTPTAPLVADTDDMAPNPTQFLSCFTEEEVVEDKIRKERGGWDGSHEQIYASVEQEETDFNTGRRVVIAV